MDDSLSRYLLRITKVVPNPDAVPDKPWYGREPDRFLEVEALSMTVTDAQFQAIRKAVLEVF